MTDTSEIITRLLTLAHGWYGFAAQDATRDGMANSAVDARARAQSFVIAAQVAHNVWHPRIAKVNNFLDRALDHRDPTDVDVDTFVDLVTAHLETTATT